MPESNAAVIARLDERVKNIEQGIKDLNAKMDNGCPFGRLTNQTLNELKDEVWASGGLKDRIIALERQAATWVGKWGGATVTLVVIAQLITLAVAVWAAAR